MLLPIKKFKYPLDSNDCIEQEKYVIVLKADPESQFARNWYFLSKNRENRETTIQDQIEIYDTLDEATTDLWKLKAWLNYPESFVHPVTVKTRVSIWGDWSIPLDSVSEV
jgi:hypothetical protein